MPSYAAKPREGGKDFETPMQRLWRRFLKARGAKTGLALISLFALAAFLAPFLAHRLPLIWHDGNGWSFPLIREFFAPSDTTEPRLEAGINFLFVFLPVALLAWRLMDRRFPWLAGMESRGLALLFGLLLAGALWFSLGGMLLDGAGRDWFHAESAPVPELDDLADPSAIYLGSAADGAAALVRAGLEKYGWKAAPPPESEEAGKRALLGPLQKLIEGPALAPAAKTREPGTGGGDAGARIDQARRNRLLVEAAFPGLLPPMRQFRFAFITLAAVTLSTLIGLTGICLIGAGQFTLSPRWLVLLILALLLSLAFRLPARHNHTPYRQLAAEGEGFGIFPLIPYGPNEQGFGPRLPPEWFIEPPFLTASAIRFPERLRSELADDGPGAAELASRLDELLPPWRDKLDDPAGLPEVVSALNRIIAADNLLEAPFAARFQGDPALAPYFETSGAAADPIQRQRANRLLLERLAPGVFDPIPAIHWKKTGQSAGRHYLGTDESGRDVLVRIIHGARVSLSVGFVSVLLATAIGLVLGSLAAYYGGGTDMAISRFLEIMTCFPSFFLILAVIAVLDKRSIVNIMLVIGLTSWTGVARLVRGEMLRQKKMDYVAASVALGASDARTIFRHILPNAMAPVLVSISFGITGAILTEAGLSFIGFGVTPPTPTWGQLLSETRDSPLANWWLAVFPGLVLFLGVTAYNLMGEALRDALDPRTSL
ncbi:MAG: ABC transporter permease [Planctomycetota bacterium]|jgi:peptide/nickel transport system permease protein|nr:ABC transporter permease [Planctomycetota bacterium]